MKKQQILDKPETWAIILKIESLLPIENDQTQNEIAKLTEQLSEEEQRAFLDHYLHLYFFDVPPEIAESMDLKEIFSLYKLKGE